MIDILIRMVVRWRYVNFHENNKHAKKPASKDWHKADIIAAVCKTGTSLRAMSRKLDLAHTTSGNALHGPYPKYERLIAEQLIPHRNKSGQVAITQTTRQNQDAVNADSDDSKLNTSLTRPAEIAMSIMLT